MQMVCSEAGREMIEL